MAESIAVGRWAYVDMVMSPDHGPDDMEMRHVLHTLSLHMNPEGGSAFPSQALLAKRTKLAKRTVMDRLQKAEEQGWIQRSVRGKGGHGWRLYSYQAAIPSTLAKADVVHGVRHVDKERGACHDGTWRTPGNNVVHPVRTNSSSNSNSNNNSSEKNSSNKNGKAEEKKFREGRTPTAEAQKAWEELLASGGKRRDERVQSAIYGVGGWQAILYRTAFNGDKLRGQFIEAYCNYQPPMKRNGVMEKNHL